MKSCQGYNDESRGGNPEEIGHWSDFEVNVNVNVFPSGEREAEESRKENVLANFAKHNGEVRSRKAAASILIF